MASEFELRDAIVEVAKADTGPGGLVQLTGKTRPIVRWGDRAMQDRPIVTVAFPISEHRYPRLQSLGTLVDLDVWVGPAAGGLEDRIAERLEAVITQPNLAARGVDAAPSVLRRRDLADLEEGGQRKKVEMRIVFTT